MTNGDGEILRNTLASLQRRDDIDDVLRQLDGLRSDVKRIEEALRRVNRVVLAVGCAIAGALALICGALVLLEI